MHVRRTLAALLVVPCALVAACGGGSSVADPPISSGPTSSAPTQPPAHETPEHFIRRWAAAEKRMENTGKTGPYLAISHDCASCRKLAKEVRGFYRAGGYVRWAGWSILAMRKSSQHANDVVYAVRIDSAPTRYKRSASTPVQRLSGGPSTELLTLRRVHGRWQMNGTAELAS